MLKKRAASHAKIPLQCELSINPTNGRLSFCVGRAANRFSIPDVLIIGQKAVFLGGRKIHSFVTQKPNTPFPRAEG